MTRAGLVTMDLRPGMRVRVTKPGHPFAGRAGTVHSVGATKDRFGNPTGFIVWVAFDFPHPRMPAYRDPRCPLNPEDLEIVDG